MGSEDIKTVPIEGEENEGMISGNAKTSFELFEGPEYPQPPPTTPLEGPKAPFNQYYAAIVAHLGAFIMAAVWSWSSTALPSLRKDKESIGELSIWQEAWIASITFLAGALGSFATGSIAQKMGLKMSLQIAAIPLFIGWVLVAVSNTIELILLGRFITGFFVAGVGVSTSLIGELSHPDRRGRLNFGFDLSFCAGVLYIYVIGTSLNWRWQAGACAAVSVVFFVLLLTIPESPVSSLQKGKDSEAKEALQRMRDNPNVTEEFRTIKESVQAQLDRSKEQEKTGGGCISQLKSFKSYFNKETLKPIGIAIMLQFFLQVCGVVPIVCYAVDVFKAAGGSEANENLSTIVLGLVNLLATFAAFFIVDKHGRRGLMIWSEVCLTLTLGILGIFLYLRDGLKISELNNDSWSWFPLACFVVYITGYSFGVGPLPWVLMGEIFEPNAKGFSSGVVILAARVFGFLVMFFFNDMIKIVGQWWVYWFFAWVCASGLVYSYFFLPETKGRTLEQIQQDIQNQTFHHRPTFKPVADP